MAEGYYWARHHDGTCFVVLRQNHRWYCCGLSWPMNGFDETQIVMPIPTPVH